MVLSGNNNMKDEKGKKKLYGYGKKPIFVIVVKTALRNYFSTIIEN